MARLKTLYNDELKAKIQADLNLENVMQIPRITKITLNMGVGGASQDKKTARWCTCRYGSNCWSKTSSYPCA